MSSLVPKIKIGLDLAFRGRNVSCMTHGTSEIGYVYPTYCRRYTSKAKVSIAPRTGVRFSPLFVPTMGKLDVRHYFDFVPFNRVYAPFDAFLAKEPYNFESSSRVPDALPYFKMNEIIHYYLTRDSGSYSTFESLFNSTESLHLREGLTCCIYKLDGSKVVPFSVNTDTDVDFWKAMFQSANIPSYQITAGHPNSWILPSVIVSRDNDGDKYYYPHHSDNESNVQLESLNVFSPTIIPVFQDYKYKEFINNLSFPTYDNCDWLYQFNFHGDTFYACFNLNGRLKRLRSLFQGLGYSFNFYDADGDVVLRLLAYYRVYYYHFGITRDSNFNDTPCAKLTRYLNGHYTTYFCPNNMFVGVEPAPYASSFSQFLDSLVDLPFICPPDYFTTALQDIYGANTANTIDGEYNTGSASVTSGFGSGIGVNADNLNAWSLKMANVLLRRVNVNNVIGRRIVDKLRSLYGDVSVDDDSTEGVYRLGSDNVPIDIGAIYNQSSAGDMPLGGFAGIATGGKKSNAVKFEAPSEGVLICITAVVPEMGYFQGKLREVGDGVHSVSEFFNPDFDALGYQSVRFSELVADRNFQMSNVPSGTSLGSYGYQPRYTHLKVGFNRVLGDLSLPHMVSSMLPYTLDRYFDPRSKNLPLNTPTYGRRGDIGNTNRIFTVVSPTDDHIIYQIFFDVKVSDSMKSLQDSFDTFRSGDNKTIEVSHE